MKFEVNDNLVFLDWILDSSPLCCLADAELDILEHALEKIAAMGSKSQIEAVIWIQKVPVHDFHLSWSTELKDSLLRDELRWRLRRWYCVRQQIQFSSVPWIYVTESSCQGMFFELMLACQRRFVFNLDTWFGFPEISIGSFPASGWLAGQILKRPRLVETLKRRPSLKAAEVIQYGLIDAAINWKDWRLDLLAWAKRQILAWQHEQPKIKNHSFALHYPQQMWSDQALKEQGKSPVQLFLATPRIKEVLGSVDFQLLDTAAQFYCHAQYETWVRQGLQNSGLLSDRPIVELVYVDLNEALPPLSLVARLLDNGFRICFFAMHASLLSQGLEALLNQLDIRYRRSVQQQFEFQLAWYVGESPREPQYPTIGFGVFRNFLYKLREFSAHGWLLSTQGSERLTAEVDLENADRVLQLKIFFDNIYDMRSPKKNRPVLYYVKSLALQAVVDFSKNSNDSLQNVLVELRELGWKLLGSERHWQRFLEYRSSLSRPYSNEEIDYLFPFELDQALLQAPHWQAVCEISNLGRRDTSLMHGAGYLQSYLCEFMRKLRLLLLKNIWVENEENADLYLADALGFPDYWGTASSFDQRIGLSRPHYSDHL